ncbi:sensor domain-containing diguanylate cyclase [Roseixanthobacter glucoisosaccharinicivorans]|uniref:sensor domain-containing diguanylate cyclase n=1 Tax=Roseixanthobacter glucoisosaccharinicivorans TaxID=3119923 RepID=UPI00372A8486
MRQLLGLSNRTITEIYDHYLTTARAIFGMDVAIIALVKDGAFTPLRMQSSQALTIREGQPIPEAATYSIEAIRTGQAISCPHVARDPVLRAHPIYADTGLESYMGAPIRIGDEIVGSFSLLDAAPREQPFSPEAMALLELLAETLGRAIERDRMEAERREADKERTAAINFFQTAFANAPIGITLVDLDGKFLRANPAACRLFGYSEEELQARDFQSLTYPDDLSLDLKQLEEMKAGLISEYEMDKRYVRPDGALTWAQLNVALVRNEDGSPRCFISQIHDITEEHTLIQELDQKRKQLEEANQKLTQLASLDPLTGALNRRALRQRLDQEMARAHAEGTPLAFIMVDVDDFKPYNDRYGHLAGDIALKEVAQCMRAASRANDAVCRFGGEEFLLLLPQTPQAEARKVAERVRQSIATSTALPERLTVSAGVHVYTPSEKGQPIDRLIAQADAALYEAKRNGKNRVEIM